MLKNCNLANVQIPDSVVDIGDSSFQFNNLTNIQIPNSVVSIGARAFGYNNLTNIQIPNSVTFIGRYAFRNNNLTSIVIPKKYKTTLDIYDIFGFSLNELNIRNRECIRPSLVKILPVHRGLADIIVDYLVPCNELVLEVNK